MVRVYHLHEQHTVHLIVYHMIWCLKRRRRILVGPIAERLEQLIREVTAEQQWEVLELAIQPDHVHLFLRANPYTLPTGPAHQRALFACFARRVSLPDENALAVDALDVLQHGGQCERGDDAEVH